MMILMNLKMLESFLITSNGAINEFKNARTLLNERKSNLLFKETN